MIRSLITVENDVNLRKNLPLIARGIEFDFVILREGAELFFEDVSNFVSGGYVVGREDLIDLVARRLYTPGIAGECGLTFNQTRTMLQGFLSCM